MDTFFATVTEAEVVRAKAEDRLGELGPDASIALYSVIIDGIRTALVDVSTTGKLAVIEAILQENRRL